MMVKAAGKGIRKWLVKAYIKAIYNDNDFISTQELEELIDSLRAASEGAILSHSDTEQVAIRESLLYRRFEYET